MSGSSIRSIRKHVACLLLLLCSTVYATDNPEPVFIEQQHQAEKFINNNQGAEALQILNELVKKYPTFQTYILLAQANAETENPTASLASYQLALDLAGTDPLGQRVALFGIAKMQLWLEHYPEAESNYKRLLKTLLSDEDKKIASTGLNKALKAQNKPPISMPAETEISSIPIASTPENAPQVTPAPNSTQNTVSPEVQNESSASGETTQ